jgi:hypothetical protein
VLTLKAGKKKGRGVQETSGQKLSFRHIVVLMMELPIPFQGEKKMAFPAMNLSCDAN